MKKKFFIFVLFAVLLIAPFSGFSHDRHHSPSYERDHNSAYNHYRYRTPFYRQYYHEGKSYYQPIFPRYYQSLPPQSMCAYHNIGGFVDYNGQYHPFVMWMCNK